MRPQEYCESSQSLLFLSSIERSNGGEHSRPISSCKRLCSLICKVIFVVTILLVLAWPSWLVFPDAGIVSGSVGHQPLVRTLNGTYIGIHSTSFEQDAFLGIPYAKPPLGRLRFRHPEYFTDTWSDIRNATDYGPHCLAYGVSC